MQKPTENDYIGDSLAILKTVTYDVATIVNDETKKLRQEVLELKRQLRLEQERTSKMEIRSFEMVHDLIKRNEAVPLKCPDGGEHKWVLSHSRLESRPFAELNKIAFHECMKCGRWGKHASIIEKIKEKEKVVDSFIDSELIPPFHEVSAYELGLETDAAITIQSYWRGYMPRVWLTFRKTKPDVYRNPNIQWEKYVLK